MKFNVRDIKIDKGIPMPTKGCWVPLLRNMKIGESFEIHKNHVASIYNAAKRNKFETIQQRVKGKKNFVRVWRLK